jgi:hypothetical protein
MTVKLNKQYIVDENNRRIAVKMDIQTFEKIKEVLENYALYKLMTEDDNNQPLSLEEAKLYYQNLDNRYFPQILQEICTTCYDRY